MVLNIEWSGEARADVRRLDKPAAERVFDTLLRFARTGEGDVRQLKGRFAGKLRLRSGSYRLIVPQSGDTLRIHSVRHRSEAYADARSRALRQPAIFVIYLGPPGGREAGKE